MGISSIVKRLTTIKIPVLVLLISSGDCLGSTLRNSWLADNLLMPSDCGLRLFLMLVYGYFVDGSDGAL